MKKQTLKEPKQKVYEVQLLAVGKDGDWLIDFVEDILKDERKKWEEELEDILSLLNKK
jgi:hypothetical protein